MTTYHKYKPSGIEWIGVIPEHWEVKRLKYLADANPSNIDKKSKGEEQEVYLCNYVDVYKNETIHSNMDFMKATASNDQISKFILKQGDVILTKDSESANDIGIPALVTESFDNVVCGYHLTHITPKDIQGEYLFRQFQCRFQQSYFEISANGVTRFGLGTEKFTSALVVIPEKNEQTAIATYLDRKTAEIDRIIANKQKLIALYEEEKQTVINQAVTRGVDKNVKLKPTGVEWLGDIPEHWEMKRLRHVTEMKSGDGITSENIKEVGEYPVFGGNGLRGYFDSFTHDGNYVLIGRQGALCGNINYATDKFWASEHAIVCTLKGNHITNWFGEVLRTMNLNQYSVSAAQPGLSIENLKVLQLPVPPIDEQNAIVVLIEKECSRLDTLIDKFKKQIELFQEYRTTLISEVVTGKVKIIE
jgi:type I restriction enzyme S subunit